MDLIWLDVLVYFWVGVKSALICVAALIALSGFDDLLIDLFYAVQQGWRRLTVYRRFPRMTGEALSTATEQPVAILIPAWQESAVIGPMLETMLVTQAYRNYAAFVGCYPNDPETCAVIEGIAAREPRVIRVIVPHDGPTSKPDCLGAIITAIRAYEAKRGAPFAMFVLHDAEDVVHPFELRLFNHLIPRKDMVQTPVLPLERPLHDLVGGHYMDEFAEMHTKDLAVREALTGTVVSAGVGCAFSREAIEALSDARGNPFRAGCLTEDYDIANRLAAMGRSGIFVRMPVTMANARILVATREYFPDGWRAAVRQKARWQLGIVYQGMELQGWRGSWRQKYLYLRDRKAILAASLNMAAYAIMVVLALDALARRFAPDAWVFPPLVEPGSILATLLLLNLAFLINRLLHRATFVTFYYGWAQGLMSMPRQVVGNLINFAAALRATRLYLIHQLTGRPLAWDKTVHAYPDAAALKPFRARLGQILVDEGLIDKPSLAAALKRQKGSGARLGELLVKAGTLTPEALVRALSLQEQPAE